jgi:hypothetical protein
VLSLTQVCISAGNESVSGTFKKKPGQETCRRIFK